MSKQFEDFIDDATDAVVGLWEELDSANPLGLNEIYDLSELIEGFFLNRKEA